MKPSSLQQQMTLVLSVIITGLLLLVSLPLVIISVQFQTHESFREQQALADTIAGTVSRLVQSIETGQAATLTAEQDDPRLTLLAAQITTGLNLTASTIIQQLQTAQTTRHSASIIVQTTPRLKGIARFTLNGTLQDQAWQASSPPADLSQIPQTELFSLAKQGLNAQEIQFQPVTAIPLLLIATPIVSNSRPVGVLMAWVNVQSVWQAITDLQAGQSGILYLTDQTGKPVVVPQQFSASTPAPYADTTRMGLNGKPVVKRTAAIPNTPWQVVVEIPTAEANAGLRSLLIIVTAIILFGISLAITVARIFSQWLLQPIKTLHYSAERISRGDLSHRIILKRDDELGFLAIAFNQMVATLQDTITNLRSVSLRLLSAEENERRRIAHEIHDELGQTLTALRFSLSVAAKTAPDNPGIAAAQEMAQQAQEKARTLSHELRPPMLDDLGLQATLEWYIDRIEQRANLAIRLDTGFTEASLPSELKTAVYRLVTEALTNISKHAGASAVEVILQQTAQTLTLIITDDGKGFAPAVVQQSPSLGIAGMRERVNLLQGTFILHSEPGTGTEIIITLPV